MAWPPAGRRPTARTGRPRRRPWRRPRRRPNRGWLSRRPRRSRRARQSRQPAACRAPRVPGRRAALRALSPWRRRPSWHHLTQAITQPRAGQPAGTVGTRPTGYLVAGRRCAAPRVAVRVQRLVWSRTMRTRALVVADDFRIVRDRAIPAHVVAWTDVDDVVALGQPPSTTKHDVVLVARRARGRPPASLGARPPRRSIRRVTRCHRPARRGRSRARSRCVRAARTTCGGGTSSIRNQAIGTSSASPIEARQESDGDALSFSICERYPRFSPLFSATSASVRPRSRRQRLT